MRIAFISNSIIPLETANSIQVIKMCEAFSDQGHEVVLLFLKCMINMKKMYLMFMNFME